MCKSLVTKKTTHDSQVSIHWLPGGFTDVHGTQVSFSKRCSVYYAKKHTKLNLARLKRLQACYMGIHSRTPAWASASSSNSYRSLDSTRQFKVALHTSSLVFDQASTRVTN